jgi:predicted cupin superfamily sugar epimerase
MAAILPCVLRRPVFATAQEVIASLRLAPLPGEGGFVRQSWRSENASAAYYLMTGAEFSALHRLRADEVWHFYAGDVVEHVTIEPAKGVAQVTQLGPEIRAGNQPQLVVPRGTWQGARIAAGPAAGVRAGWALIGCTLTPAWQDRDFELGARGPLLREFPAAADWIRALTR